MLGAFFNQVDLETGRGKIKRGLNAADPSTDNHDVSKIGCLQGSRKVAGVSLSAIVLFPFSITSSGYFDSLNHFLDNFRDVLNLDLFGNIQG